MVRSPSSKGGSEGGSEPVPAPRQLLHNVLLCTVMPTWLLFVIAVGAVMRLSRLVTADKISESLRERLTTRWGDESLRAYFISCDFCVSIYVAPVVATVAVLWPDNRVVIIALLALTASFIAGTVAAHE